MIFFGGGFFEIDYNKREPILYNCSLGFGCQLAKRTSRVRGNNGKACLSEDAVTLFTGLWALGYIIIVLSFFEELVGCPADPMAPCDEIKRFRQCWVIVLYHLN